jgi:ABC-2 type transport system ATP-binding protein
LCENRAPEFGVRAVIIAEKQYAPTADSRNASQMITIENLVKTFGPKRAVDGISFTVERGEVLGFLGPNGAGKSTTMRMITGFMPPNSGKVTVGGYDVAESPIEAKRLIGYLPENAAAYPDMTVAGFLKFAAELRGLGGQARKRAVQRVIELCFLDSVLHQSIDTLSKGYKHRTCLAQALIHDPQVLIMDEPTDGLDPNQKHEVRNLIRELGATKAIVFSTHILEEVDAACTRAIIIDRGKIVANGTPGELRSMSELAGAVTLQARGATAERLATLGRVEQLNGAFRIYPRDKSRAAELAQELVDLVNVHGWKVEGMYSERGELDEVFRRITLPDTMKK